MKTNIYILQATLIGLAVFVISLVVNFKISLDLPTAALIIFFSVIISSSSFLLFKRFRKNFSDQLLVLIIGLFTVKLVVYLIISGIIIWLDKSSANVNVAVLLSTYLVFTAFETFAKWSFIQTSH